MATYVEYQLEDGGTILVEVEVEESELDTPELVRVSRGRWGDKVLETGQQKFTEAFDSVKSSALTLRRQLEELRADEVTVTFGLKATGEFGNFAVGKAGMEANYTVTLKWSNSKGEVLRKDS